jgi:hypothetical protein
VSADTFGLLEPVTGVKKAGELTGKIACASLEPNLVNFVR